MSKEKHRSEIDSTYKTMITYKCPVRGSVTEEVLVTKYKKQEAPEDRLVDGDVAELLRATTGEDLDEAGFQEDR